jgi:hypothetical protein
VNRNQRAERVASLEAQDKARYTLQTAIGWVRAESGERLDPPRARRYIHMIEQCIPLGESLGDPVVTLTPEVTKAWRDATRMVRNRAIALCGDGEGDFCIDGLNEFLEAVGLEEYEVTYED